MTATGDAKISILKNNRQVVNFSVVVNDTYKTKVAMSLQKFNLFSVIIG